MWIGHGRQRPKSWVTLEPLDERRADSTVRLSPTPQATDAGPSSRNAGCGEVPVAGRKWPRSGAGASVRERTSALWRRERLSKPSFGKAGRRPLLGRGRARWQCCPCSSNGVLRSGLWAWSNSRPGAADGPWRTPGRLRPDSRRSTWGCPPPWSPANSASPQLWFVEELNGGQPF